MESFHFINLSSREKVDIAEFDLKTILIFLIKINFHFEDDSDSIFNKIASFILTQRT